MVVFRLCCDQPVDISGEASLWHFPMPRAQIACYLEWTHISVKPNGAQLIFRSRFLCRENEAHMASSPSWSRTRIRRRKWSTSPSTQTTSTSRLPLFGAICWSERGAVASPSLSGASNRMGTADFGRPGAYLGGEPPHGVQAQERILSPWHLCRFRNLMSTAAGQKFLNENLHRTSVLSYRGRER